ncbi:hypothetical protein CYMTET_8051 [Cymbomonas tetramitiformis]|uniref:Uncharacterized protein n=1 Tax=Cymbomonas tetramitiformis TaxID=36881 RepID=A0AAE0GU86_9CHLO|nr:hypothetical protein CYMTET_8051 [Cymbomonas tetramitiformis]
MSEIKDWPTRIKALREAGNSLKNIMQLLSTYPLANQTKHFRDADVEWTEQERETLGMEPDDQEREEDDLMGGWNPPEGAKLKITQIETGRWAEQEDPMETPGQEGTHIPTRILASRQYLDNHTDRDSRVVQYDTQWTNREGGAIRTWSMEETIRTHLLTRAPCSDQGWGVLMEEWERTKHDKQAKREPEEEILAGRPSNEQRYWKNITHLEINTRETNPDQDIKHVEGTKDRQLRTEGDTTYCYEPEGGLIGSLSTVKVREMYN